MAEESKELVFRLKRKYILGLGRWLSGLTLQGRDSRERTKFVESLSEEMKENELTRMDLLHDFADKDEAGEPLMVDGENNSKHYKVSDENMPKFTQKMNEMLDEEIVMSGPGNIQRFKTIKNIILNTTEPITPDLAEDYVKWCEAAEAIEI
jgi:hypothetical protein